MFADALGDDRARAIVTVERQRDVPVELRPVRRKGRAQAIAQIDLLVNIATAVILTFGLGRLVQRFGVTAGLVLNPIIMLIAFLVVLLSPSLIAIQGMQVVRRVAQYAIARPSRTACDVASSSGISARI